MSYVADDMDISIIKQHVKHAYFKCVLTNMYKTTDGVKVYDTDYKPIAYLEGEITGGSLSIDAESAIRRTLSLNGYVKDSTYNISSDSNLWMDKFILPYYGLYSYALHEIRWYPLGVYVLKSGSYSFNETTKEISLECTDLISLLNGDVSGQICGMQTLKIESATSLNGKQNTIKNAMEALLNLAGITNYDIDNIGDNQPVTEQNPNPTYVPYDMTYSTGCTFYEPLEELKNCYSGYELYADVLGKIVCHKYPTCESDPAILDESIFDSITISEDDAYDFSAVKNITEVFGKCIDTERYDPSPNYEKNTNTIVMSLDHYCEDANGVTEGTYQDGDIVGFTMPSDGFLTSYDGFLTSSNSFSTSSDAKSKNELQMRIYVPTSYTDSTKSRQGVYLPAYPIVLDYESKEPLPVDTLQPDTGYCFYVKGKYWIYMGEFQVHAVSMLVDDIPDSTQQKRYINKFGTTNIHYITVNDSKNNSQFTVEKCGELINVLSGDDFDKIYTSDLARQRSEYENWKTTRFVDALTVQTIAIPWLDVNQKIRYRSIRTGIVSEYIINSIQLNMEDGTMTMDIRKFYPTYPFLVKI